MDRDSWMTLDRSKLHNGFRTYLANAEAASGKTWDDFAGLLAKSGLKKHGELRSYLMEQTGLGHGHANAVVAIWLKVSGEPAPAKKASAKRPSAMKTAAEKTSPKS